MDAIIAAIAALVGLFGAVVSFAAGRRRAFERAFNALLSVGAGLFGCAILLIAGSAIAHFAGEGAVYLAAGGCFAAGFTILLATVMGNELMDGEDKTPDR